MIEILSLAQGIVERGIIFAFVVAAVYIAARIINFNNLSIEGAFGLGGSVAALLLTYAVHPLITLLAALGIGAASGVVTALLHTKLKINHLISGIVVTTATFSFILKLTGANKALGGKMTLFSMLPFMTQPYILLIPLCVVIFYVITWLLKTEVGFLLYAVGDTPQMVTNVGKSISFYIMLGLMLSNALAALSGALFVHYVGYFSIWANVGVLIIGLAGMILADMINTHFSIALILGSIAYQAVIAFTFELQIDPEWNKAITALFIVILIAGQRAVTFLRNRYAQA